MGRVRRRRHPRQSRLARPPQTAPPAAPAGRLPAARGAPNGPARVPAPRRLQAAGAPPVLAAPVHQHPRTLSRAPQPPGNLRVRHALTPPQRRLRRLLRPRPPPRRGHQQRRRRPHLHHRPVRQPVPRGHPHRARPVMPRPRPLRHPAHRRLLSPPHTGHNGAGSTRPSCARRPRRGTRAGAWPHAPRRAPPGPAGHSPPGSQWGPARCGGAPGRPPHTRPGPTRSGSPRAGRLTAGPGAQARSPVRERKARLPRLGSPFPWDAWPL